jgi:hypothetical protein
MNWFHDISTFTARIAFIGGLALPTAENANCLAFSSCAQHQHDTCLPLGSCVQHQLPTDVAMPAFVPTPVNPVPQSEAVNIQYLLARVGYQAIANCREKADERAHSGGTYNRLYYLHGVSNCDAELFEEYRTAVSAQGAKARHESKDTFCVISLHLEDPELCPELDDLTHNFLVKWDSGKYQTEITNWWAGIEQAKPRSQRPRGAEAEAHGL